MKAPERETPQSPISHRDNTQSPATLCHACLRMMMVMYDDDDDDDDDDDPPHKGETHPSTRAFLKSISTRCRTQQTTARSISSKHELLATLTYCAKSKQCDPGPPPRRTKDRAREKRLLLSFEPSRNELRAGARPNSHSISNSSTNWPPQPANAAAKALTHTHTHTHTLP